MRYFDAHCHIHLHDVKSIRVLPHKLILMGSSEDDWPQVAALTAKYPDHITPAFGVHPWSAHKRSPDYLVKLRHFLESHPNSIIGEIGLDKKAVDLETKLHHDTEQLVTFLEQLDLAIELRKPMSVHCVGSAWGDLQKALQARIRELPVVCFHSYLGSSAWAESLLVVAAKHRRPNLFYFSFSSVICLRSPKTPEVIATLPASQILLESDLDSHLFQMQELKEMTKVIAKARGLSPAEAAALTTRNAFQAFNIADVPFARPRLPPERRKKKPALGLHSSSPRSSSGEDDGDSEVDDEDVDGTDRPNVLSYEEYLALQK